MYALLFEYRILNSFPAIINVCVTVVCDFECTEVCVGDNEEVPLKSPNQQAEIRGHLFHNIAASWFPKAAGFAQKVQADIWAAAKLFPC